MDSIQKDDSNVEDSQQVDELTSILIELNKIKQNLAALNIEKVTKPPDDHSWYDTRSE